MLKKSQTKKKFVGEIENFLISRFSKYLEIASLGWRYAITVDSHYLSDISHDSDYYQGQKSKKITQKHQSHYFKGPQFSEAEIISKILAIPDSTSRWSYVQSLVTTPPRATILDSFAHLNDKAFYANVNECLSGNTLNVVIMGAGCTGLLLANALKYKLGERINILIIENRALLRGIKQPYNRRWITNIDFNTIGNIIDPSVAQILKSFGSNNFIGVTIDIFETLLLLSCKNIGVKFYFNFSSDLSFLEHTNTHMIFDATGGNWNLCFTQNSSDVAVKLNYSTNNRIEKLVYNFVSGKTKSDGEFDFILKKKGNKYHPYFKGHQLKSYMFKITGIPLCRLSTIEEYVKTQNTDNIFYVWIGKLIPEINEVLVIINLLPSDFEKLSRFVVKKSTLDEFINKGGLSSGIIDFRVVKLIKILTQINSLEKTMYVEKPFCFTPHITVFDKKLPNCFGVPIFPIGDSIFCGHPKVGNGLGFHVNEIKKLNDKIISSFPMISQKY